MGTNKKFQGIVLPILVVYFAIIVASLLASACASTEKPIAVLGSTPLSTATPALQSSTTPTPSPSVAPNATPIAKPYMKLSPVKGYATEEQRKKIAVAEVLLNKIVQSDCFYEAMSSRKLIQTNGRTSSQVARHVQSIGGELPVQMYYRCYGSGWKAKLRGCTTAVAYRQPPFPTVYLNSAYFYTGLSTLEWASTLAHEGLGHSLGEYGHDFNWNAQRDFSVPYSINFAIEKCGKGIK